MERYTIDVIRESPTPNQREGNHGLCKRDLSIDTHRLHRQLRLPIILGNYRQSMTPVAWSVHYLRSVN